MLTKITNNIYIIKEGKEIIIINQDNINISNIKGDVSNIYGDVSNIIGDVSNISGDFDEAIYEYMKLNNITELTEKINVNLLLKK